MGKQWPRAITLLKDRFGVDGAIFISGHQGNQKGYNTMSIHNVRGFRDKIIEHKSFLDELFYREFYVELSLI